MGGEADLHCKGMEDMDRNVNELDWQNTDGEAILGWAAF